ncbi:MAG TPA: putative inorganic carbon transporter subunit DabA, partial [Candidatus Polarisedimenticolia bacterium]|nr:putative inorganic carbon transporter subunit DabA [Candidatus Polarisedimenticolia bacterium]
TDAIDYFDLHRVPEESRSLLREAIDSLQEACQRNAHERCRRFKAAPLRYTKRLCLSHVQTRAEDLAQTRPEYGHATNAFCVVGRRRRTRELFLDRRAFLVSYDPERDDDGATVLARVLAGVVPVVAGISLEYYFAVVDPIGYGCGTKLPHNVTALLGVMDGHASDLRTGLPRQMVEIHEPVRLTLLVETPAATLERLVRENPDLRRLVANRWIVAAALDPVSSEILELSADGVTRHEPAPGRVGTARSSAEWYQGRRGFLGFALIEGGSARTPNP